MRRVLGVWTFVAILTSGGLGAQSPHGGQSLPLQPGPNVNAVGGVADPKDPAALVKADLNLQRQNETVLAASTRNTDHILAAANDYRFVDFPQDQYYGGAQNFFTRLLARLFGRPGQRLPARAAAAVGAWTGVYRSCDRGRTWIGSALPGSPLDFSEASSNSALKRLTELAEVQGGHAETTDPVMVAGPGGRMHLVVLGFVRFPNGSVGESRMYYASYTDRNNLEGGSCFSYDFMQEIDRGAAYSGPDSPLPFIDKPSVAIDKDGTLYAAYTVFADTVKSKIVVARSTDGGATWSKTIPLLNAGFLRNHGATVTIDPVDGTVYVAWRMFYDNWPLMVVSRSPNKGRTFLPATPISNLWPSRSLEQIINHSRGARLQPFDQTSGDPDEPPVAAARAFAFPTIAAGAVDGKSKLFAAWTERAEVDPRSPDWGLPSANGSPRIMLSMSSDGGWTWTPRRAVDAGPRTEHLIQPGVGGMVTRPSGPQIQPVLSMSGTTNPQLLLMYYEAREELDVPFAGNFISGIERMMDVRTARVDPATGRLLSPSVQVSQYPVTANSSPAKLPEIAPGYRMANRQNLTMYAGGTTAFIGDYPGLAPSRPFEFRSGRWNWSADPSPTLVMWTDNRDVAFPLNAQGTPDIHGAWANYQPLVPTDPFASRATDCSFVASRNANPYFSEIGGVIAGAPQSFKPLTIQRAFATYVENRTPQDRFFRLTIEDNELQGIDGSFDQFDFGAAGDVRNVEIFANSSHHRTIWVQPRPQGPTASLSMLVQETVMLGGALKADGYRARVVLNPDPNNDALTTVPPQVAQYAGNPAITAETSELHNPQISSPQISTFRVSSPQISSPQISSPQISTPQISSPQISSPQISSPQISSSQISTPQISTAPPDEQNGTDVTYTVRNEGTTWTTYDASFNVPNAIELIGSGNYQFQVLVTRTSLVPSFTQNAGRCSPALRQEVHVLANIPVPQISSPQISTISNPQISSPQISSPQIATFSLAPAGGAGVSQPDGADPDSHSPMIADQVQVTVRAIALKPRAAILASGGRLFDPAAIEARVTSASTNVVQGVVEPAGSQPAAVTRPDLVVTNVPVPPGLSVSPGAAVALAPVTIRNQGSRAIVSIEGGSSVGYYLSADPVITAQDTLLASDTVFSIAAGGEVTLEARTLTIPQATAPGAYYLGVLADRFNVIEESDEGNNYVSRPITIAAQPIVTSTSDTGPGSLRDAILAANATPGVREEIRFNFEGPGPHVITLATALPSITDPVFIDGASQPGYSGVPLIVLDGSNIGAFANGLTVTAGSSLIKALIFTGFAASGVRLEAGGGNSIQGSFFGTDATGTSARPNRGPGIFIVNSANNTVGGTTLGSGNLISGNRSDGILVLGDAATGNRIFGNLIGTDVTGTAAIGNEVAGIEIQSAGNIIGGPTSAERNVVSGNTGSGITISGAAATGNVIQGNFVGTSVSGTVPVPNLGIQSGIFVINASDNTIGGTLPGAGNVVSGNAVHALTICCDGARRNVVQGNFIGTDPTGLVRVANAGIGIDVISAVDTVIGGIGSGRNVISGNGTGIQIRTAATGTRIENNYVGTNADGTAALSNGVGVSITDGTSNHTVGGEAPGTGNVISGNVNVGLQLTSNTTLTKVQGNKIGTNAAGTSALGNGGGIFIAQSPNNLIGGTSAGAGNVISGNGFSGIGVVAGSSANIIQGNLIGTDVSGTVSIANQHNGVFVEGPANIIGGTSPGARNVISGNAFAGMQINPGADGTVIQGNYIGVDITGSKPLGNASQGVLIDSSDNVIGGSEAGAGNVISGNQSGIYITNPGPLPTGNRIEGNLIGTNAVGTAAIGNLFNGVTINGGANNQIGGPTPAHGNIIRGNNAVGIYIQGTLSTGNRIANNRIGPNGALGIDLEPFGVTANDSADVDTGPNDLQNAPALAFVEALGSTRVSGSLHSTGNAAFAIEIFTSTACDPSRAGEGEHSLGTAFVATDETGEATFEANFDTPIAEGDFITATATSEATGSTSEFSNCLSADPWFGTQPPGSEAETTATNPRAGNASLELLHSGAGAFKINEPGTSFGRFGDLTALSFDWAIDPESQGAYPPDLALRVYPFDDPRSFFLHWDNCNPCLPQQKGVWHTTNLIGQLAIQPDRGNPAPASLAEIPPDAPIFGIHIRSGFNFGYPWFGFVDNVTLGFSGREPMVFNFELANPATSRSRPTITWTPPAPIAAGTPLSAAQLNASANVPGVFVYDPPAGTLLTPDIHALLVSFTPTDTSRYMQVSYVVPLTVTGLATVLPDNPGWFPFVPGAESVAKMTAANERSGNASLELAKSGQDGAAYIREPHVIDFGKVSELTSLSMEWFIDPASDSALPPQLALRVYDFGDPRSFFLYWDTCSPVTPCDPHPTGSWQSTDLIGKLRIQSADGNPPPASLAEVAPDAPITGIHIRADHGFGGRWHGFADNVAIGFAGREPIVFNFEIDPGIQH